MNSYDKDKEFTSKFGDITTSTVYNPDTKGQSGFGPSGSKSQFTGNNQNQSQYGGGFQGAGASSNVKQGDMSSSFGLQKSQTMTKQQIKVDPYQTIFSCTDEEINEMFNAFQNNGIVNLDEFATSLETVGYSKKCSLLISKIERWRLENKRKDANEREFKSFFRFDLRDEKDFKFVFDLMLQGKNESALSRRTLTSLNIEYALNFTNEDMNLMISNLNKGSQDAVFMKDLYNDLYKNQGS